MTNETRDQLFTSDDVGCLVDDRHGIYAMRKVCDLATSLGWQGFRDEVTNTHALVDLGELSLEDVADYAEEAEIWLNENKSSQDCSFGWHEGGFFYQSDSWWAQS